ncbi:macronuclear development protein 1 [Stylonychia lemnae]|uniref:Macronuclear development protein 1 n=1 Tax=Stylonychia lemnae TaxID=5949 RepID=A0A078AY83_STYLE|nr:macronuclear development protein 1 [Stylonychia lemnae]|eukprot:CDW87091.1 macronuclear development protein 1 [Stylonychia lemnae]
MIFGKKSLQLIYSNYCLNNWTLYCQSIVNDTQTIKVQDDNINYEISIEFTNQIEFNTQEYFLFIRSSFLSLMKAVKFEQIGRNCFDSSRSIKFQQHKMEIWPGFDIRLTQREAGIFLNIEPCYKVIRNETALEYILFIKDMCESRGLDFFKEIQKEMENSTVIAIYSNKAYRISKVDFDVSPQSKFSFQGQDISFLEYYKSKYNEIISDQNQPLLLNLDMRTGKVTHLIPELCKMTGITAQMKDDFKIMREIKQFTHSDAPLKVRDCQKLFQQLAENKYCKFLMDQLDFKLVDRPLQVKGYKYESGNMIMGKASERGEERIKFDIESNGRDLDRKTQCRMYDQPQLLKWGIFYQERDSGIAKDFLINMEKSILTFGYPAKQMASFVVKGNTYETWRQTLLVKLDSSVQAIVLILPGYKDRCQLYPEIKRMLLEEIPVISQVVLTSTLLRGRNVRSIVSKILIQLCAKIGGIPWIVDKMPILDRPTMICGMDVYHMTSMGKRSVLGFCSSYNNSATKYWSKTVIQDSGVEVSHNLQVLIEKALRKFQKVAGIFPEKIIFYRDGVGDKQLESVSSMEIGQIMSALKDLEMKQDQVKLMYIIINKRINTRLFAQGELENHFKNPIPGVVVNSAITEKNMREFYLVSCQAKQGMVKPTRYTIIHDSVLNNESTEEIELLTYKLCHTYFNVAGAISIPAPVQYAHKLAYLVGEIGSKEREPPVIHQKFEDQSGLFFI